MNLATNLLDLFYLLKGRKNKVEKVELVLSPLIERLRLPEMPRIPMTASGRAKWVRSVIRERFPAKASRRVVRKIAKHYGADLRGYGFFKAIPGTNMLRVLP